MALGTALAQRNKKERTRLPLTSTVCRKGRARAPLLAFVARLVRNPCRLCRPRRDILLEEKSMEALLSQPVEQVRLTITAPDGQRHTLKGSRSGPEASIRITDNKVMRRMLVIPDLYLGEAYMEGSFIVEAGRLYDVLDFFAVNLMPRLHDPNAVVLPGSYRNNVVGKAKDNVAFHYDLNRRLFELFLDRDLQYSCAYFSGEDDTLEQAQTNKKKRVAAKLLLEPGMRVLDIGSGFGGLALHLVRANGVDVF